MAEPNANWHKTAKVFSGPKDLERPNVDLSKWAHMSIKPQDETVAGIPEKHFAVFLAVAKAENCIIVVRKTKPACLPWIKMGFPSKPSSVYKVKTSERTGIVTCSPTNKRYSYAEQVKHAWEANHYVLHLEPRELPPEAAGGLGVFGSYNSAGLGEANRHADELAYGPPMRLVARWYHHRLDKHFPLSSSHEQGQVIDPQTGLPLTGDYDLMGVMPMDNPTGQNLVLIHNADDKPVEREASMGGALLRKMRNNPYGKRIASKLNEGFGSRPRVMHGAHDLKYDPSEDNEDGCAVFSSQLCFFLPTAKDVDNFYKELGRLQNLPNRPERAWRQGQT
jgi:hypothetical protein